MGGGGRGGGTSSYSLTACAILNNRRGRTPEGTPDYKREVVKVSWRTTEVTPDWTRGSKSVYEDRRNPRLDYRK